MIFRICLLALLFDITSVAEKQWEQAVRVGDKERAKERKNASFLFRRECGSSVLVENPFHSSFLSPLARNVFKSNMWTDEYSAF